MTPRDFASDLERRVAELNANRPRDVLQMALEFKALIQLRIQDRGYNFQERPFSPYTPAYAKNRQKSGYQAEYVDFTRTGRLWANVRPEVIENTETKTVVEITARDDGNQRKLQGAVKKRGNILLPSQKEIDLLTQLNRERLARYGF